MSLEAVAGKNPVSHVGKVYSLLAQQIAKTIYRSNSEVEEVYVWVCSRIGRPVDDPWLVSTQVALAEGAAIADVTETITKICHEELRNVGKFCERLARGELSVC
jgi:S-adenosylmethionine synthetase